MSQPPEKSGGLTYEEFAELLAMMDGGPYEHVRAVLRFHGRQGTPFKEAWASAMRSLPRGSGPDAAKRMKAYRANLQFQREGWRKRYELLWPESRRTLADALRGRMAA